MQLKISSYSRILINQRYIIRELSIGFILFSRRKYKEEKEKKQLK